MEEKIVELTKKVKNTILRRYGIKLLHRLSLVSLSHYLYFEGTKRVLRVSDHISTNAKCCQVIITLDGDMIFYENVSGKMLKLRSMRSAVEMLVAKSMLVMMAIPAPRPKQNNVELTDAWSNYIQTLLNAWKPFKNVSKKIKTKLRILFEGNQLKSIEELKDSFEGLKNKTISNSEIIKLAKK